MEKAQKTPATSYMALEDAAITFTGCYGNIYIQRTAGKIHCKHLQFYFVLLEKQIAAKANNQPAVTGQYSQLQLESEVQFNF